MVQLPYEHDRRRVALLAEGVDRNKPAFCMSAIALWVALLAEGVDRNKKTLEDNGFVLGRPPRGGRG